MECSFKISYVHNVNAVATCLYTLSFYFILGKKKKKSSKSGNYDGFNQKGMAIYYIIFVQCNLDLCRAKYWKNQCRANFFELFLSAIILHQVITT